MKNNISRQMIDVYYRELTMLHFSELVKPDGYFKFTNIKQINTLNQLHRKEYDKNEHISIQFRYNKPLAVFE
jgi:hypothetical protein